MTEGRGVYIGPDERLVGERAILQFEEDCPVLEAQFNNHDLLKNAEGPYTMENSLGFGWHQFPVEFWEIDREIDWSLPPE